jgi:uncharacterized membrane protein YsdA (DUF1294 family)
MSAQPIWSQRDGRLDGSAFAGLLILLVLPAIALSRLAPAIDWRILVGVPFAVSLFTYLSYRSDKRRAEAGEWRIPEATLHLAELAGGWPGAFLAQRSYRHKTAKLSFQIVFWLIVLLHQFVALDFLLGWKLTKGVLALFD